MTDDDLAYGRPIIRVLAACESELIDEGSVSMLNIEEDIEGADVVTFKCPLCGDTHKSRRFGRG